METTLEPTAESAKPHRIRKLASKLLVGSGIVGGAVVSYAIVRSVTNKNN